MLQFFTISVQSRSMASKEQDFNFSLIFRKTCLLVCDITDLIRNLAALHVSHLLAPNVYFSMYKKFYANF